MKDKEDKHNEEFEGNMKEMAYLLNFSVYYKLYKFIYI